MQTATPQDDSLAAQTKLALRRLASSVAVVTCRDGQRAPRHDGDCGQRHEHAAAVDDRLRQSVGRYFTRPSARRRASRSTFFTAARSRSRWDAAARPAARIVSGSATWGEEGGVPVLDRLRRRASSAPRKQGSTTDRTRYSSDVSRPSAFTATIDPLIYVDGQYTCLPPDAVATCALQMEIEMMRQIAM